MDFLGGWDEAIIEILKILNKLFCRKSSRPKDFPSNIFFYNIFCSKITFAFQLNLY